MQSNQVLVHLANFLILDASQPPLECFRSLLSKIADSNCCKDLIQSSQLSIPTSYTLVFKYKNHAQQAARALNGYYYNGHHLIATLFEPRDASVVPMDCGQMKEVSPRPRGHGRAPSDAQSVTIAGQEVTSTSIIDCDATQAESDINNAQHLKLAVVGLGKLGSPMAATFASKGFLVTGTDINPNIVKLLSSGIAPVNEPGLQNLIDASKNCLKVSTSIEEACSSSQVTFIMVPTPSLSSNNYFDNSYVLKAIEQVGKALSQKDKLSEYHLVVITSTVMPGSCDQTIKFALENASKRPVGDPRSWMEKNSSRKLVDRKTDTYDPCPIGLCYNPEFIALGSVLRDMMSPDLVLIGESDDFAGSLLASIYQRTCSNNPPIHRMNFANAEITKISINTFVTTKISYANMLADLCDRLPNADVNVVSNAVGADSRIGRKYLTGATAYGGPCFPRDNKAFASMLRNLGGNPLLAISTDELNEYQSKRIMDIVQSAMKPWQARKEELNSNNESFKTSNFNTGSSKPKACILGISYKPFTPVIEESQGIKVGKELSQSGFEVFFHDPSITSHNNNTTPSSQTYWDKNHEIYKIGTVCLELKEALENAQLVVIMTPWPIYANITPNDIIGSNSELDKVVVIDCWRQLPRTWINGENEKIVHVRLGARS